MFQEFYTDTLLSRYIKTLLQTTPLPLFDSVTDGDMLTAGCYYVYKQFLIQCVTGGRLEIDSSDYLCPSNSLYPSVYLFPGHGYRVAQFKVKSFIDTETSQVMRTYASSTNYYDPQTHRHLGKYLRYIRTRTNINLLPFYNEYGGATFTDIKLYIQDTRNVDVELTTQQLKKVIAVPIQIGKRYLIAIDCPTQVLMRTIVYSDTLDVSLTSKITGSSQIYPALSFENPVEYTFETSDFELACASRNLYLVIQLPLDNDSSITVQEKYDYVYDDSKSVTCDKNGVRKYSILNPSLLYMNTHRSYAFSDRLVEYLVGNVITSLDPISRNIEKVQTAISKTPTSSRNMYEYRLEHRLSNLGLWDDNISHMIQELVYEYARSNFILDQDGNINKDVEKLLLSKGVNY